MKLTRTLSVAASSLLLVVALGAAPTVEGNKIADRDIADAIEDQYLFDYAVDLNKIDVNVHEGIVELTGKAENLLAKDRATYLAERVKGVRSVSNRIDVKPSGQRSAAELRRAVKDALFQDPAADSYEIDVDVAGGFVTLSGTVESFAEKQLSERVVKGVRGVTGIDNNIEVEYRFSRPDAEIQPEIERRLRWDALLDDGLIDVAVNNGAVTLSGSIGSAAAKRAASYDAWVAGVKSVDTSGLEVNWWAKEEELRKDKYVSKPDSEIARAIKDAALYDPRVISTRIDPDVQSGWVTLRGDVASLRAKRAAEDLARNTVGVNGVTNRLKVRPVDQPTDSEIENNIVTSLFENPFTDSYEIGVSVHNGNVTLTGTVDSSLEKTEAELVASRVRGTSDVFNYLTVSDAEAPMQFGYRYPWYTSNLTPPVKMSDAEIKDEVENQLWWSPLVDSDQINVTVEDGVVTLTGQVDSLRESQDAVENAYEGGAERVTNLLTIG